MWHNWTVSGQEMAGGSDGSRSEMGGIEVDGRREVIETLVGGKVIKAKCLKTTRNGEKCDSLSMMIKFDESRFPAKVFTGYISYEIRPYILHH